MCCVQFATVSIPVSETFAAKFMEQIEVNSHDTLNSTSGDESI